MGARCNVSRHGNLPSGLSALEASKTPTNLKATAFKGKHRPETQQHLR